MKQEKILALIIFAAASLSFFAAETVEVNIKEWDVPKGAFPHDPAVGPDGSLWYTGQRSNTIGRVNPKTGEVREYSLKTPDSGPHGLVADNEGNIWYTGNSKSYIGKLNPTTGEVTEFPMPDPGARDPHTPVFDQKGILWFTVQGGNLVGSLDPRTGLISLKDVPTPKSRPYGIVVNSKGTPWFCEFNSNKLASINPATLEITEHVLPEGARPRRLTGSPDDMIYYSDYARGYLGKLDPETGKVTEWPSPGGTRSRPYGIAATADGRIWYSESGVDPNTLVVFDPKTEKFKTWPIPSGGGVIRHMVATPAGNLFLACSGVNKVGVVEISYSSTK
ncbi:MAG: lyase [Ignavibacteriales bacterium]|nr:lyase [Ignavibacteriales bacterium]